MRWSPSRPPWPPHLLQADRLVPIHYGGYDLPGVYEPVANPLERLAAATDRATPMTLGETIEI